MSERIKGVLVIPLYIYLFGYGIASGVEILIYLNEASFIEYLLGGLIVPHLEAFLWPIKVFRWLF